MCTTYPTYGAASAPTFAAAAVRAPPILCVVSLLHRRCVCVPACVWRLLGPPRPLFPRRGGVGSGWTARKRSVVPADCLLVFLPLVPVIFSLTCAHVHFSFSRSPRRVRGADTPPLRWWCCGGGRGCVSVWCVVVWCGMRVWTTSGAAARFVRGVPVTAAPDASSHTHTHRLTAGAAATCCVLRSHLLCSGGASTPSLLLSSWPLCKHGL